MNKSNSVFFKICNKNHSNLGAMVLTLLFSSDSFADYAMAADEGSPMVWGHESHALIMLLLVATSVLASKTIKKRH